MRHAPIWTLLLAMVASTSPAATYHVSTGGDDLDGDGSPLSPWRTIAHAVNVGIAGAVGDSVLVESGLYDGPNVITRGFDTEIVVRAVEDHGAVLTNLVGANTILAVYVPGSANLAIEGFVITGEGASGPICDTRQTNMIHFENASDVRFENNIVYGNNRYPFCNDLMKINRSGDPYFPRRIRILGNVFYDHPQVRGNDLIDSVRPGEIEITDNIFFSDLGVSEAQNFITLKREVVGASVPADVQSPRYRVNRNIFLAYEGHADQAMLNFGEDGVSTYELTDVLVENNLFIGNSENPQAAPFQFKGTRGVTVRANTVVGDMPATAYGFLIGTTGTNPTVEDVFIHDNVFADPTGTMGPVFLGTFGSVDLSTIQLDRNLYWNGGNALPASGALLPADDAHAVVADPDLPVDQAAIVLPKWDTSNRRFVSGSTSIRAEFERLVETYGALAAGSAAIGAADPALAPTEDILGRIRDASPDLGAYEFVNPTSVGPDPSTFSLSQNSPNPFAGWSTFHFELSRSAPVHLALFDVRGRRVRVLVDGLVSAGRHRVTLGADRLAAGVYFYRLRVGGEDGRELVRRCVVLR